MVTSDNGDSPLDSLPSNNEIIPVEHAIISTTTNMSKDYHDDDASSSNHTYHSFFSSTSFPTTFEKYLSDTTKIAQFLYLVILWNCVICEELYILIVVQIFSWVRLFWYDWWKGVASCCLLLAPKVCVSLGRQRRSKRKKWHWAQSVVITIGVPSCVSSFFQ